MRMPERLIRPTTAIWNKVRLLFGLDGAWPRVMRQLGEELEELNTVTESEFLSIGRKLQGFYQKARETTELSSSIAVLLSGGRISDIIDRIGRINDRIRLLEDDSTQGTSTLRSILETIQNCSNQLDVFNRIVRQLHILCISIKIENARLGGHNLGFDILADDVGKLAVEIEQRCNDFENWSAKLCNLIRETLEQVVGLEATLKLQFREIITKTMKNLESLRNKYDLSTEWASELASRYDSVSRGIGEIITSLQFHDITRQQIEHVKETLDGLADEWEKHPSSERKLSGNALKRAAAAADICALQRAQLRHAGGELTDAVKRIVASLGDVAFQIAEMTAETRSIVGNNEAGRSFLEEIELGFSSLADALAGQGKISREVTEAIGSVGETLDQMSAFAADIEAIGLKIKMLSLNAIVKSAQIGAEGVSLAVLAEGIQQLSTETRRQTGTLSDVLRSIASSGTSLDDPTRAKATGTADISDYFTNEIETVVRDLREMDAGIQSMQNRISSEGQGLAAEIEQTVSLITIDQVVAGLTSSVTAELDAITCYLQSLTATSDGPRRENLKILESAYTMEAERQIHESLAGTPSPADHALAAQVACPDGPVSAGLLTDTASTNGVVQSPRDEKDESEETAELGDNVELF